MIIIRMSGGLGNQMFQYALYLKLVSLGREVCFDDTTKYTTVTDDGRVRERRPKMLGVFGINVPKVRQEDLIRMTDSDLRLSSRVRRKITGRRSKLLHDQDFHFDPEFLRVEDGCGSRYWSRPAKALAGRHMRPVTVPRFTFASGIILTIRSCTAASARTRTMTPPCGI